MARIRVLLIRLPVALGPVDRAALPLDVGKLMAKNQQAAVVSGRGHVSGSAHELEGTLSEGWRPRASWTARHERAWRALDDRSGPADRGERARTRLRSAAGDRPRRCPASDRVRAIFRPTSSDKLVPGLERFIGREESFDA
jgi:hypothetical protein